MNAMALTTAIVDRCSNGLFDSTHGLSPEFALDVSRDYSFSSIVVGVIGSFFFPVVDIDCREYDR